MSPLRHFLLGWLYLLTSGGGSIALAVAEMTQLQASVAEYVTGYGLTTVLEAPLPNERCATGRTGEGRSFRMLPASVWVDPYLPPVLSAAAIAGDEADPVCRTTTFLTAFARAPPVCS